MPGVIHDYCSAAHPMGVGSPFWKEIDLARYGLTWKWPEVDCAHPLDDGTAGVLYQSIDQTAEGMGSDGRRWRLAVGDLAKGFDDLGQDLIARYSMFRATHPAGRLRAARGAAGHGDRPVVSHRADARPLRWYGCARVHPVGPAADRSGGTDVPGQRPPLRLAGRRGRIGLDHGRTGRRAARTWRRDRHGRHRHQPRGHPRRRHRDAGPEPRGGTADLRRCDARADQTVLWAIPAGLVGVQGRLRHRGPHPVDQPRLPTCRHCPSGWHVRGDCVQRG